ncbi:MAG: DUF29 family protein [Pseudomonadota bacterium]
MSDKLPKLSQESLSKGDLEGELFDWEDLEKATAEAAQDDARAHETRPDPIGARFLRRSSAAKAARREVAEDAREVRPGARLPRTEPAEQPAIRAPSGRRPERALVKSVVKPLVDPADLAAKEAADLEEQYQAQRRADLLLVANRLARVIELLIRLRYGRRQEVEWSLRQALKTEREDFGRVLNAKESLRPLADEAYRGAYRLASKQALAWFEHFDPDNLNKYRKEVPRRSPFRIEQVLDESYWPDSEGLFPHLPLALRLRRKASRLRDKIEYAFERPDPHLNKDRNVAAYRRLRYGAVFNFVAMLLLVSLGVVNYGLSTGRIAFPAHMTPFEPLDLNGEDTYAQRWKIWRTGYDGDYCQQAIVDSGARVKVLDDQRFSPACSKIDVVEMAGLSQAAMKPLDTKCAVAVQTYLWERRVVQPAAQKHFGIPVSEVLHFGSYNCRTMRGSNRMSQHARANAIDVSGFRLKNGRVISLVKDWNGSEEERAFLRDVRDGACDHFTAVLGPEFNALHADHFHFDLGWWPKCK